MASVEACAESPPNRGRIGTGVPGRWVAQGHGTGVVALVPPVLVVIALAAATLEQGAYYVEGRLSLGVLVVPAAALVLLSPAHTRSRALRWATVWAVALGAWAFLRGWQAGTTATGAGVAGLLAVLIGTVLVCRRTNPAGRQLLRDGVVGIAVIVAATGWLGTARHVGPWGMMGASSWRASSTLTYPNAAAALLVVALLVTLAERTSRSRAAGSAVVATLLLTALLATQSRGGLLALAVGSAVLAAGLGVGPALRAGLAPTVGAVIAVASLLPALAQQATPRPVLASFGLAAGMAVAVGLSRLEERLVLPTVRPGLAVAVLCLLAVGAASVVPAVDWPADRMTLQSTPRLAAAGAALGLIGRHPLAGVGPARTVVEWQTPEGSFFMPLIHNEYLQTATALGLVGAALLGALLVAAGVALVRSRRHLVPWTWWGPVAGLAALAVHSAFDFLWHLAVLPAVAAVLLGVATTTTEPDGSPADMERRRA